jgi:tetratricopeptide (TPR) repeat protein
MNAKRLGWIAIYGCSFLWPPGAAAHHGPTKAIDDLTHRIERGERSPLLFVRRGDEYRALGELDEAAADYVAALELDARYVPALYGLAHVHFDRGQLEDAAAAAERGLEAAARADDQPPFHALLARAYEKGERPDEALQSWDRALASPRPDVDWFLEKTQLLWKLERPAAAEEALRAAIERNPSEVLRRAWYESLIRSGKLDEAERHIETGLENARWKSAWLLLRARVRALQSRHQEAHQDALAALLEIEERLNPGAPNPFLAAEKAQALAALGHADQARRQAKIARSLGVPAWKLADVPGEPDISATQ